MKRLFLALALVLGLLPAALGSSEPAGHGASAGHGAPAALMTPAVPADEALQVLKDGNARYVAGQPTHPRQGAERRAEITRGQHPIATILGCSDSRAPLELIFDQGAGDLFVIRVAGNIVGQSELATVEYGVGHLGTGVVLVLGHTACGAVTAAVQDAKAHGALPGLLGQIKPAVAKAKAGGQDDLLNRAIKANVHLSMENLLRKSRELREYVDAGKVLLVGGIYDLSSGKVSWLGQHPEQGRIMAQANAPAPRPKPKPKPEAVAPQHDDMPAKAEPEARHEAKPAAKAAKAGKQEEGAANPNARSDGDGSLLAPPPAPAAKPAAKGAHP